MTGWDEAADALEAALQAAARLVEGELVDEWEEPVPHFDLTDMPKPATVDRIRDLLIQVEQATASLEHARRTVQGELDQLADHRRVASAYLRTP